MKRIAIHALLCALAAFGAHAQSINATGNLKTLGEENANVDRRRATGWSGRLLFGRLQRKRAEVRIPFVHEGLHWFFFDIQHFFAPHGQGRPLAMGLLVPD